jgi:hypothetical protein
MKTSNPRIRDILVENMDHDDPAIRLASLKALRKITGKDLGVQPEAWREYFHPEIAATPAPKTAASTTPTATPR